MRRADAQQEIRAITRVCRGPFQDEITAEHLAQMSQDLAIIATSVDGQPISALQLKAALVSHEATKPLARELDDAMRPGCGADFNNIVANGPLDGKVHAYKCSSCGVTGIYRAPRYDDLED